MESGGKSIFPTYHVYDKTWNKKKWIGRQNSYKGITTYVKDNCLCVCVCEKIADIYHGVVHLDGSKQSGQGKTIC